MIRLHVRISRVSRVGPTRSAVRQKGVGGVQEWSRFRCMSERWDSGRRCQDRGCCELAQLNKKEGQQGKESSEHT